MVNYLVEVPSKQLQHAAVTPAAATQAQQHVPSHDRPTNAEASRSGNCSVDDWSPIYRCALAPHALLDGYPASPPVSSLYSLFLRSVYRNPEAPCLGRRVPGGFEWYSYAEVNRRVRRFARGLLRILPVRAFPDERYRYAQKLRTLGIYARNDVEWMITDLACAAAGVTLVPLYETQSASDLRLMATQTQLSAIVTSCQHQPKALVELVASSETVDTVIFMDPQIGIEDLPRFPRPVQRLTMSALEALGGPKAEGLPKAADEDTPVQQLPGQGDRTHDVHAIRYTSGTTGSPKGVLQTHGAFLASLGATERVTDRPMNSSDVYLSYLPLAHLLDNLMVLSLLAAGGAVGFGHASSLTADCCDLQPTVLCGVPQIFSRLLRKAEELIEDSPVGKKLAHALLEFKVHRIANGTGKPSQFLPDLALRPIARQLVGGRLQAFITGGAPIAPPLHQRLVAMFSANLVQVYGMTECMGVCRSNYYDVLGGCSAGGPIPAVEISFGRVTAALCGESSSQGGELLIRGATVTPGYFRNSAASDALVSPDGWLHTGDVARIIDGRLHVLERVKDSFKLAQGEYVTPSRVEEVYSLARGVTQCFVDGDSLHSYVVGIVVPNLAALHLSETATDDEIRAALDPHLAAAGACLAGFERMKKYAIRRQPFTVEEGLLTSTTKPRRVNFRSRFKAVLQSLYNDTAVDYQALGMTLVDDVRLQVPDVSPGPLKVQ